MLADEAAVEGVVVVVVTVGVVGVVTSTGGDITSIVIGAVAVCPLLSVACTVMTCVPTSFCVGTHVSEPVEDMSLFERVVPLNESLTV